MRVTGLVIRVTLALWLVAGILGAMAAGHGGPESSDAAVTRGAPEGAGSPKSKIQNPKCSTGVVVTTQPYTWRNVEIVGGGFVSGILFSPKQRDLIYARTDIGGAYRWNPSTRRWIPLLDWVSQPESNLLGVESLATDPSDPRLLYAAVGTYTQSWAGNGAILRSNDRGTTWQRTDMPFKMGGNENGRSMGERLAVDPNQGDILYFGSRTDGLWRSHDGAATWNKVGMFPVPVSNNGIGISFVVFDARTGAHGVPTLTIFVGVTGAVEALYRSIDAGATWSAVPGQPEGLMPHHGVIDADGMLYLTYGNGPGPNGVSAGAVWKFDTHARTWTDISPVRPESAGSDRFGYAGLAIDPKHKGAVMVSTLDRWSAGDDIFRTTDGGSHWVSLQGKSVRDSFASPFVTFGAPTAKFGWWIGALAIDPFRSDHVLYGTGATIWGSDDAAAADRDEPTHWTVRARGLEETAALDLISPPTGAHLISALGDIGGFRHDDLNVSPRQGVWKNPIMNSTEGLDFAQSKPEVVARVGSGEAGKNGALSLDGGHTWQPFAGQPVGSRGGGTIAVSADGSSLIWTPRNGAAAYSSDRGATWTVCEGLPRRVAPISDRIDPEAAYAYESDAGKVYVSTDRGAHFTPASIGLPIGRGRLQAGPTRAGDLWLENDRGGLYRSTNGGVEFKKVQGIESAYTLGFGKPAPGASYPAVYLVALIGNVTGVFRSDNEGATWIRINDDAHQYGWIGQAVTGDPRIYGRIYLATNGRGILYADPAVR